MLIDGDARWSWPELAAWSATLARWLGARGLARGDRVGVIGFNRPQTIALWLAAGRMGVALVFFSARLTPAELRPLIERAGVREVLDEARLEALPRPSPGDSAALPAPHPDDVAAVLFTSGTTGAPKPVELRWSHFDASARASFGNLRSAPSHRWLLCLPLFHIAGLALVHRCRLSGAGIVLERTFDARRIGELIDRGLVTHASLVSTLLSRLVDARQAVAEGAGALEAVLVGGGPVSPVLLARARQVGMPVLQTYGLTECCSQVATERPGEADGTTAGPALPSVELRIVAARGRPCAAGEIGEIEVRGPMVAAPPGDWLATHDLGCLDARGRLTVASRRTDLIVTGGENVYPLEVERVLLEHPTVAEAAVVPRADEAWGQVPVAVLALRRAIDAATLSEWTRSRLAGFKVPRAFVEVAELPRNAMGKVDRLQLRRMVEQEGPASRATRAER
jgi:O-succinylbenzoic acid--CoA ligase